MKNQTTLVVLTTETSDNDLVALLEDARAMDARVLLLILSQAPTYPVNAYGHLPYGSLDVPTEWIEQVNTSKALLKERTEAVKTLLQKAEIPGEVHAIQCVPFDAREIVARRAMVCDIATIVGPVRETNPAMFHAAAHGILFEAPIGLCLNASPLAQPEHIFIAWNTELPASRAVHAALPMIKGASQITIGCVDHKATELTDGEDPGTQVAQWLSHHGADVTVNQYTSGGHDVGAVIRRRAQELGADLIVMGAYGHTRLREVVFGGVTRSMLDDTELPVFLAH